MKTKHISHTLREKCLYLELFWSAFFCIRTDYREIRSISPYSVRMLENADQNNSEYGQFLGSDKQISKTFVMEQDSFKLKRWWQSLIVLINLINSTTLACHHIGELISLKRLRHDNSINKKKKSKEYKKYNQRVTETKFKKIAFIGNFFVLFQCGKLGVIWTTLKNLEYIWSFLQVHFKLCSYYKHFNSIRYLYRKYTSQSSWGCFQVCVGCYDLSPRTYIWGVFRTLNH